MGPKSLIKDALASLFEDYRINWIYASASINADTESGNQPDSIHAISDGDVNALETSQTPKVKNSASFNKAGLEGYVLTDNGQIACVAHFADAAHYDRAGTWPISPDEMALMDIATEERAKGKGYAARLIAYATRLYHQNGKSRLIAFIWWSNKPSVRAFTKAGWQRVGFSFEICRNGTWRGVRIPLA